jgi:hypothetical protein
MPKENTDQNTIETSLEVLPALQNKNEKTFKQCLDESTNLLTCFGVFNALTIYTGGIGDDITNYIAMIFLLLSVLVLHEIHDFSTRSNNGSHKFKFYTDALALAEMLIIVYIVLKFPELRVYVVLFGLLALYYFSFYKLCLWILKRNGKFKINEKVVRNWKYICFLCAIILLVLTFTNIFLFIENIIVTFNEESEIIGL